MHMVASLLAVTVVASSQMLILAEAWLEQRFHYLIPSGTLILRAFNECRRNWSGGQIHRGHDEPSTFLDAGWDFNQTGGTWKMTAGQTYPRLAWETLPNTPPSDLNVTAPLQVLENQPEVPGRAVHREDPDCPPPSPTPWSAVPYDNHFFSLDANGTLRTASALDYEANATLTIRQRYGTSTTHGSSRISRSNPQCSGRPRRRRNRGCL